MGYDVSWPSTLSSSKVIHPAVHNQPHHSDSRPRTRIHYSPTNMAAEKVRCHVQCP